MILSTTPARPFIFLQVRLFYGLATPPLKGGETYIFINQLIRVVFIIKIFILKLTTKFPRVEPLVRHLISSSPHLPLTLSPSLLISPSPSHSLLLLRCMPASLPSFPAAGTIAHKELGDGFRNPVIDLFYKLNP